MKKPPNEYAYKKTKKNEMDFDDWCSTNGLKPLDPDVFGNYLAWESITCWWHKRKNSSGQKSQY